MLKNKAIIIFILRTFLCGIISVFILLCNSDFCICYFLQLFSIDFSVMNSIYVHFKIKKKNKPYLHYLHLA